MVLAFVMIEISPQAELMNWDNIVKENLEKVENVKEVHTLFGRYDLIVKVEANNIEEIDKVVDKSRSIQGVSSTETFIVRV